MSLPLLISVPHAGHDVPTEIAHLNQLTHEQIVDDGDEGADRIFSLEREVSAFVSTLIARAFVDMNRADNDMRADGVVKTETIYRVRIYEQPLRSEQINQLLARYYYPYHKRLTQAVLGAKLGLDCHTMAAVAPPIAPDAGTLRPSICLSNADGTCPQDWFQLMSDCLQETFNCGVAQNDPFRGGFIIRSHAHELPWMQVEISRADFMTPDQKRDRFLQALTRWCKKVLLI